MDLFFPETPGSVETEDCETIFLPFWILLLKMCIDSILYTNTLCFHQASLKVN